MNTQDERKAFEALQNPIVFERFAYIEKENLYIMKNDFRNDLFTMTKCNELNFGWKMYQESAKRAEEKLEGCVVVPKDQIEVWWQDSEEPENFATKEGDLSFIAQHIEDDEIMKINEHHTIHLPSITKFGAWIYQSGQRKFFVGTKDEVEAARGGK